MDIFHYGKLPGTTPTDESDEIENSIELYRNAEQHYTKLALRYFLGWFLLLCFYGVILMVVPLVDVVHNQLDASNWTTLFKTKQV